MVNEFSEFDRKSRPTSTRDTRTMVPPPRSVSLDSADVTPTPNSPWPGSACINLALPSPWRVYRKPVMLKNRQMRIDCRAVNGKRESRRGRYTAKVFLPRQAAFPRIDESASSATVNECTIEHSVHLAPPFPFVSRNGRD